MGKKHKPKKHKSKGYDGDYDDEREGGEKESLKIVLKVGGTDAGSDVSYSHDEKKHKHKKKKKKKDRDRHRHTENDSVKAETEENNEEEEDFSVSQGEEEDTYEPPSKRALLDIDDESNSSQDIQPRRSSRQVAEVKEDTKGVLRECLHYIQKHLQRKDVNGFFAYPVNDVIAPGYSSIIKEPMDFSTMLTKIENDTYDSIMDYKNDYVLMCNNAMTYNRPETIYYKEAKRLLQSGLKMMSKEKLLIMRRSLGFMSSITMEEIGINQEDNTGAVLEELNAKEKEYEITVKNRDNIGRFEAFQDNMTPDEILAQAQSVAQDARDTLAWKKPKTKLSFLRKRDDGTTSLTVINSDNDGIVGENERIISLGALTGKLTSGTGSIAGFKEDKRNKANQLHYLTYGPFSSHAPMYDTSFSNISKEESDLLLSTYGDESGVQYAQSVMKFVEDAEEDCTRIVDSLLDVLTKGQHTLTMKQIQQKRKEDKEQLETLSKGMGETENQAETTKPTETENDSGGEEDVLQQRLDKTAGLLKELQQTQHERLSQKPPPHLGHISGPGEKENQLADKVTTELTKLAKETIPQNITSLQGIRKAMGISVESVQGTDESQPIEIEDENSQSNDATETVQEIDTNQLETLTQNNDAVNFIDNELLMETDGTVIDNL
ncbi:bromodomain-containing protein 7-like [Mercenaria mercenaria]|uniref:bromodomain-containing protein 7-like n=1 Tax=Mercenaria mercenaria TaxID=6596 RepID=UPI001E1DCCA9|nr:bromodomain-containing protein 7-like [Mercenaria mercenaria]